MRAKIAVGGLIIAAAFAVFGPVGAASAEEPVDLAGEYILDEGGLLDAEGEAEVREALDHLLENSGTSLFVVIVDSFEGASDGPSWADASAERSGLGDEDVLLAIAVNDRNYAYSVSDEYALSVDRVGEIAVDRMEPSLRDNLWADGIVGFANGIDEAINPGPPWGWIGTGGVLAVGGAAWATIPAVRRRMAASRAEKEVQQSIDDLTQRAGKLLVEMDDSLKTSAQELEFAVAQFGEESAVPFRAALEKAKATMQEAFALRQRLDDAEPETTQAQREMTEHIISLCEDADQTLDAQAAAFDELRQLEKDAPALLPALATQREALAPRIATATATVSTLTSQYGQAAVSSVAGSIEQATKLDAFAAKQLEGARTALGSPTTVGRAAAGVRAAQQAIGQSEQLLTAIDELATALPAQTQRLADAIADTRSDIAEARALPAKNETDAGELTALIAEVETTLAAVATRPPAEALGEVEKANSNLAALVGRLHEREVARERAEAQLARVTASAQEAITSTDAYITTRRGVVGEAARLRLEQAKGYLAGVGTAALVDPVKALEDAQQALSLAGTAQRLATDDVRGPSYDDGYDYDDPYTPPEPESLGGILSEIFGGGGASDDDNDSWWSGWGSGGSSSSGWSSSSRSSSSGSSRSSSGSSFSSGGSSRSSGGGRF